MLNFNRCSPAWSKAKKISRSSSTRRRRLWVFSTWVDDRDFIVYKSADCKCTVLSRSFKRYRTHRDYKSTYRYPMLRYTAKANNSLRFWVKENIINKQISVCNSSNLRGSEFPLACYLS